MRIDKSLIVVVLMFAIAFVLQNRYFDANEQKREIVLNRQSTAIAQLAQNQPEQIELNSPTYTPEPTYTPKPTFTPEPTFTPFAVPANPPVNRLDAPDLSPRAYQPPAQNDEISINAVDVPQTVDEFWIVTKTILNDFGLWQPAQTIFIIMFVLIAVFAFLSYFKS